MADSEFKFVTGMKHVEADGSSLQHEQLVRAQQQYEKQISCDPAEKQGALCQGIYDPDRNAVVVTKLKGKVWSHFGYSEDGLLLLRLEEAIFLMSASCLNVLYRDSRLSMQQAFHYFLSADLTINHYLVYSHLCRLGYIVRRYTLSTSVSSDGDGALGKRKIGCSELGNPKSPRVHPEELMGCGVGLRMNDIESRCSRRTPFDLSAFRSLDEEYSSSATNPTPRNSHFSTHSLFDYRRSKSSADSWQQYLAEHHGYVQKLASRVDQEGALLSQPLSVKSVLSALRLSKTLPLTCLTTCDIGLKPFFDVYKPNANFRKKSPGAPDHRVIVASPSDDVPGLIDLSTLGPVPLYWAVCDHGDISFICMRQESIQMDWYNKHHCKPKKTT